MKIDPFLIFAVIGLIVIFPIGLTIDKDTYEGSCEEDPILYLHDDLYPKNTKFANFVDSANKTIKMVASCLFPFYPNNETWIDPLRRAVKRGVKVQILTNSDVVSKYLPFAEIIKVSDALSSFFISLAIADDSKVVYSSQFFGKYETVQSDFFVEFQNCKSIAKDATSIFNFFKMISLNPKASQYTRSYCAGFGFPAFHKTDYGMYAFAMAPGRFVAPGRMSVIDLVYTYFYSAFANISIFTPSLFPEVNHSRQNMPEMIMSDQIENTAVTKNLTTRILMSREQFKSATNITMSLSRVPRVEMRTCKARDTAPTFFVQGTETLLMPMSFESAVSLDVTSIALYLSNLPVATKLQNQFNKYWSDNETSPIS